MHLTHKFHRMKKISLFIILSCSFIFLTSLIHFYIAKDYSIENIKPLINQTLQKSIITDYEKRTEYKRKSFSGSQPRKKYKQANIQTENGIESVEFKDSLEIHDAIRMTEQYALLKSNPLKPHDFNLIFQEELKKGDIEGKTGVIYYYDNEARSSEEDFWKFKDAILSEKVFIDAKETAAVQAWVSCTLITYLKHIPPFAYISFFISILIGIYLLYFLLLKKKTEKDEDNFQTKERISIDIEKKEICLDGKILLTTSMPFTVFQLLAEKPDTFVSRTTIEQTLWKNSEKEDASAVGNRINQVISTLRNDLKEFPQFQIIYERGKGYKLTITPEEHKTPET